MEVIKFNGVTFQGKVDGDYIVMNPVAIDGDGKFARKFHPMRMHRSMAVKRTAAWAVALQREKREEVAKQRGWLTRPVWKKLDGVRGR